MPGMSASNFWSKQSNLPRTPSAFC
jgi:hypothetical protein